MASRAVLCVFVAWAIISPSLCDHYHKARAGTGQPRTSYSDIDWNVRALEELQRSLGVAPIVAKARNVILFIGDGMGVSTMTSSRVFRAQNVTGQREEDGKLSWEDFPHTGVIKTYSADRLTADSSATATAFMSGEKIQSGVVGLSQDVTRGDCAAAAVVDNEITSSLTHAIDAGMRTGIVTTARITHATPSSAYAHSADRLWESDGMPGIGSCVDIARQLVESDQNRKINVLLGGGRQHFTPSNTFDPEYPTSPGYRQDNRDLIEEWKDHQRASNTTFKYVDKKVDFDAVDANEVDHLFGLFEHTHMKYDIDRLQEVEGDFWREPSLAQMVSKSINILRRSEQGYFLFVEGGRVDHAHHSGNAFRALHDTVALSDAVSVAKDMTNPKDTLILLTADHSHTFTQTAYPYLHDSILGIVRDPDGTVKLADDGKPYLTLGYANGPGFEEHRLDENGTETSRKDVTGEVAAGTTMGVDYLQDSGVPIYSETHGGEDVAVYARGPMAHILGGQHEQSYIAHAVMYAACLGPRYHDRADFCQAASTTAGTTTTTLSSTTTTPSPTATTPSPTATTPSTTPSPTTTPTICVSVAPAFTLSYLLQWGLSLVALYTSVCC